MVVNCKFVFPFTRWDQVRPKIPSGTITVQSLLIPVDEESKVYQKNSVDYLV